MKRVAITEMVCASEGEIPRRSSHNIKAMTSALRISNQVRGSLDRDIYTPQSESRTAWIGDAASSFESTSISAPIDLSSSDHDFIEEQHPWRDGGWTSAGGLGDPVQINDPLGQIRQYNDLDLFEEDTLSPLQSTWNDLIIGNEYKNSNDFLYDSMGFIQQMYDIAMAGSAEVDVEGGLFPPTLSFDRDGRLDSFKHQNGYGAYLEDGKWHYYYQDTSGKMHEVSYDEFKENAGGAFSSALYMLGEIVNDVGESISDFFSGLFGGIIVKPGSEVGDGHLGGILRLESGAGELNSIQFNSFNEPLF